MTTQAFSFHLKTQWIVALAVAAIVLLPFDLIAGMKLTGWDWWLVLLCIVAINLVPIVGQVICLVLAVLGAYQLGQDHLAQRDPASAPAASASAPMNTPSASNKPAMPTSDFATWRKTVAAPAIQDNCIEKGQSKGLVDSRQIDHIARVCACYGAAAANVITEADVVDGGVQATPDFNARLGEEARRLCQAAK